ncbi:MAG TPA: DNA packaging Nu1 [Burkholderiaceae bacterium]|nr:DNA packaging Nu1 [Burkholderiaceae bacterium]
MSEMGGPVTQAAFGQHVGISQQAVSDLVSRGVLKPGDSGNAWRLAYCEHLREVAAGRDPDGDLAAARTRLANESADRVALDNAIKRREYAPHSALEIVLGDIARQIATRLDALVPQVRRVLPDLPASVIAQLSAEVAACRELCASANLRDADRLQRDDDEEDGLDLFDAPLAGAATP